MKIQKILVIFLLASTSLSAQLVESIGAALGSLVDADTDAESAAIAFSSAFALGYFKEKAEDKKARELSDAYHLGMYHAIWYEANDAYRKATLDPHTGRPSAFTGYDMMDIGIVKFPDNNVTYIDSTSHNSGFDFEIPFEEVTVPAGKVINGVRYREQKLKFPVLP